MMSPWQFYSKLAQKLITPFAKLLKRDNITLTKIATRDDLAEIGTSYGGWVIPKSLFNASSVCYCAGCGEDISFDLGLIEQIGCKVYGFDPTPRAIQYVKETTEGNSKYRFFDIGLWDKADVLKFYVPKNPEHVSHSLLNIQKTESFIEVKVKRLSDIMQENGHHKLDLLKLDIEGAEYKVIDSILEDKLEVNVLCVEYDECFNPLDRDYKQRVKRSVSKLLNAGYKLVYAQGNGNYTFLRDA
ncbi:FkbM family methyltransferase [Leptolyngbya boryana CZ1]|uniref:FkbM family methyltransferase n=1 Tax=Leptolyngbya boryana CZ1 TaxID=3060204 RepID=A0AA96WYE2_LEPBY|nr:FkbM family methyltransferase [Leptolyngbya boryana]WNZ47627.1 FkbM family methyltransferase [Leptolyngbya boryana CZ1]